MGKMINVLIVDDDPLCVLLAETHLKDHFSYYSVNSGHAALEAIEKQKFDVILMDINLNDHLMDGIRTMRNIKFQNKHKRIKIIAVTASSDTGVWLIKQGFDGHYMKPVSKDGIVEEIEKQVKKQIVTKTQLKTDNAA